MGYTVIHKRRHVGRTPAPDAAIVAPPSVTIVDVGLVNTSGSTQSANFITQMYGHPYADGDLPVGQHKKLETLTGVDIAYTKWADVAWSSGNKKFCGTFARYPNAIAGLGTATIREKTGGVAQTPSGFSTSVLTASALSVVLTGITNLTGIWTADLNTAIALATDITVIGDGAAGKVWRIGIKFNNGSRDHEQLYCWFYVAALKDENGNLHSVRVCPRIMQVWPDIPGSLDLADRRIYTAVLKAGATTLLTMAGTQAGELHAADITHLHYTSWFACDTNAKWIFVPQANSGGSAAAECTVRVLIDRAYWNRTRVFPAYDLSISPASNASFDYYPFGKGTFPDRSMDATEAPHLPVWAARDFFNQSENDERAVRVASMCGSGHRYCMRHSITKQVVPINNGPGGLGGNYTGMGTTQPTWRYQAASSSSGTGFVIPANQTAGLWFSEQNPAHQQDAHFWAYLRFAEPQMLDLLVEQANSTLMSRNASPTAPATFAAAPVTGGFITGGGSGRNYQVGATVYYGVPFISRADLARVTTGNLKNIGQVAGILPDVSPDGSDVKVYFNEMLNDGAVMMNAMNAARGAGWNNGGFYYFGALNVQNWEASWSQAFLDIASAHAYMLNENPAILTFLNHRAKWYASVVAIVDIAAVTAYRIMGRDSTGTVIEDINNVLFLMERGLVSWDAGTNRFSVGAGGLGNFNFTPTAGDKIAFSNNSFDDAGSVIPTFVETYDPREILFIRDVVGQTFKVAKTLGGTALTLTNTTSTTAMYAAITDYSPLSNYNGGSPVGASYLAKSRAAMRALEFAGASGISTARIAADTNASDAGLDCSDEPSWALNYTA